MDESSSRVADDGKSVLVELDEEIDFSKFFVAAWENKAWVLAVTIFAALSSIVVSLSLPNIYESRALLSPKAGDGTGGLSNLASQFGGIANLAGINIGSNVGEMTKAKMAQEKMRSLSFFTENLYEEFSVELMALDFWDAETRMSIIDSTLYDMENDMWVEGDGNTPSAKPTPQEAFAVFMEIFSIVENSKRAVITLSLRHQNPITAQKWLNIIIQRINEDIRARDIKEADESIRFLAEQRQKTKLVSLDGVFAQLIEEQTKTIMLANVSRDYVFDVIDPPVVPELKVEPKRAVICVFGTLLGGFLGLLLAVAKYFFNERKFNSTLGF